MLFKLPKRLNKTFVAVSLLFLVLSQIQISAQNAIGIKGGFSFTKTTSDYGLLTLIPDNTTKSSMSGNLNQLSIAIFGEWGEGPIWTFYPEVYYSRSGASITYSQDSVRFSSNIERNAHYAGLAMLSKLTATGKTLDVYALIGPQIAYAVHGSQKSQIYDLPTESYLESKSDYDIKSAGLTRWDAGMQIGVGVCSRIGRRIALMEITYDLGLLDIGGTSTTGYNQRNFQVSMGFGINPSIAKEEKASL